MMLWWVLPALAIPVPTAEESAALAAGQTVIRGLDAPNSSSVAAIGFVDVRASTEQVWSVLLDFPGRKATNASIALVDEYKPRAGNEQWWHFQIQKFGTSVTYYNHYVLEKSAGKLTHELDTSQVNDLALNTGTYELGACEPGTPAPCTRLVWTVSTDFGRSLPGFVRNWLGRAAVEGFLGDIAARAPRY